jgi:hypothetical protein
VCDDTIAVRDGVSNDMVGGLGACGSAGTRGGCQAVLVGAGGGGGGCAVRLRGGGAGTVV